MSINTSEDSITATEQTPEQEALSEILKEDPLKVLKPGEIVEGPLLSRGTASVFVDLGAQGTGIIFGREFFLAQELLKQCDIGDTISAKVVEPENEDGFIELSVSAAYREIAWEKLNRAFQEKETLHVEIEAANRGGLMATVEGVKAFLPVSQLSAEHYPRVEGGDKEKILEALKAYIGDSFAVKIINADQRQDKLIISEKAVEEEAVREELKNFSIGDTVEGTITGVVDFGIFVKFGPGEKLEGLAHISELSWDPVENIQEQFSVDQKVKVKIIDIQGDKASLSLKALQPDPWKSLDEKDYRIGAHVSGRPVRITSFGAFVEVAPGVQGIVRVSEFEDESAMRETFKDQKEQRFTIASLDPEEHRMELKPGEHTIEAPETTKEASDGNTETSAEETPQEEATGKEEKDENKDE